MHKQTDICTINQNLWRTYCLILSFLGPNFGPEGPLLQEQETVIMDKNAQKYLSAKWLGLPQSSELSFKNQTRHSKHDKKRSCISKVLALKLLVGFFHL